MLARLQKMTEGQLLNSTRNHQTLEKKSNISEILHHPNFENFVPPRAYRIGHSRFSSRAHRVAIDGRPSSAQQLPVPVAGAMASDPSLTRAFRGHRGTVRAVAVYAPFKQAPPTS